jgi:hypothetical protein
MRIACLLAAFALSCTAIFATPANCPSTVSAGGDLGTINGNGGCFQVDNTFSGFVIGTGSTISSPSVTPPDLGGIFLVGEGAAPPVTDAVFSTPGSPLADNNNTWSVPGSGGTGLDTTLSYNANLATQGLTTNDFVGLDMSVGVTGNALTIVTETYCVGSASTSSCAGTSGSLTAIFLGGVQVGSTTPATFAATSQLVGITDEVVIFDTTGDPTSVNFVDNQFDEFQTPEPASFVLLGSALGVLGFLRRRKAA